MMGSSVHLRGQVKTTQIQSAQSLCLSMHSNILDQEAVLPPSMNFILPLAACLLLLVSVGDPREQTAL